MTTPTTTTRKDSRKKTIAVTAAAERIADQVADNRWTDEQGMDRLKALAAIDSNDPDFFKKVDDVGREPATT